MKVVIDTNNQENEKKEGIKFKNIKEFSAEVDKKKDSFDKTRNSRIHASKRLAGYNDKWQVVFLIYNIQAILWTLFSLIYTSGTGNFENFIKFYTSGFTLYVILIQYYIGTRNYGERSFKLEVNQLKIEEQIVELKKLGRKIMNTADQFKYKEKMEKWEEQFIQIMQKYQLTLVNVENHTDFDYRKANNKNVIPLQFIDFSWDNIGIYFNIIFALVNIGVIIWTLITAIGN